jgi:myo-inositol-1(or 4)-monophosphatase
MLPFQEVLYEKWPLVSSIPFLKTALNAAYEAGKMLYSAFYRDDYEVHVKADQSEFTPFDEKAERIASEIIRRSDPSVYIMGEEIAPKADPEVMRGKVVWAIDGIDGTTNFSRRIPVCNFTLTRIVDGISDLGVVYDFLHGEIYYAVRGGGAYCNGKPITVANRKFSESVITFAPLLDVRQGKGKHERQLVEALWAGMKEISERSKRFHREFQSGGLELAWVASGRLDGYASSWTSPWDLSAGALLVREAGGVATNMYGKEWQPSYNGVIAGSPIVHKEMLSIFQTKYLDLS